MCLNSQRLLRPLSRKSWLSFPKALKHQAGPELLQALLGPTSCLKENPRRGDAASFTSEVPAPSASLMTNGLYAILPHTPTIHYCKVSRKFVQNFEMGIKDY